MKKKLVQRYYLFHKLLTYGLMVWGMMLVLLTWSMADHKQGIDLKIREVIASQAFDHGIDLMKRKN